MASFSEKRDYKNEITKAPTKFGKQKEMCITPFNGGTYVHISDMRKCYFSPNGKFDHTKSKSISFNMEEIEQLQKLLRKLDYYHEIFNGKQVCYY